MTNFAITLWAWEVTGQATPLSLILVVTQIPRLLISPFAGIWVDRLNRKYLMLLGDGVAGLSTIVLLSLLLTDQLQVWHLYISGAVNGLFGYIQGLAHSASVSLLVAEKHYARASAIESLQLSSSYIIAPATAGVIYAASGLSGIFTIDLVTFGVAIATLAVVTIPQPPQPDPASHQPVATDTVLQEITFGLRYLRRRAGLRTLLGFFLISNFINGICFTNLFPMALSRLGNDTSILGTLFAFFGVGGLLGGLTLGIWGGPQRRIHGVLIATASWKVGLIVLTLVRQPITYLGTALVSGFCSPFPGSCSQAIWRSKVEPAVQGRVFAARYLLTQLATTVGAAIAGPLADYVFEPAMQPGGALFPSLGSLFGVGVGSGMAVQTAIFASLGVVIALGGYRVRKLRRLELET